MEGISMGVFFEFVANIGLAAVKDKLNLNYSWNRFSAKTMP